MNHLKGFESLWTSINFPCDSCFLVIYMLVYMKTMDAYKRSDPRLADTLSFALKPCGRKEQFRNNNKGSSYSMTWDRREWACVLFFFFSNYWHISLQIKSFKSNHCNLLTNSSSIHLLVYFSVKLLTPELHVSLSQNCPKTFNKIKHS